MPLKNILFNQRLKLLSDRFKDIYVELEKNKKNAPYLSEARVYIDLNATIIAAGTTKTIMAFKILCKYTPTNATSANTLPPNPATITNATVVKRNEFTSLAVILSTPTSNPSIINNDTVHGPSGKNPATTAISVPTINAQVPILLFAFPETRVCVAFFNIF